MTAAETDRRRRRRFLGGPRPARRDSPGVVAGMAPLWLALCHLCEAPVAGQTPVRPEPRASRTAARLYQDGPLTAADFRAAAPADTTLDAETVTELRYDYRYRTLTTAAGRCTLQLTEVRLKNWVDRGRSWNRLPNDEALLEHEQGHFDITELVRRRAAAYWRQRIGEVRLQRPSESEARQAVNTLVKQEMAPFFERLRLMHDLYDRETRHGRDKAAQRNWQNKLSAEMEAPAKATPGEAPQPAPQPARRAPSR